MSPFLMAYCAFISPPTSSASARARVCRSSSAMVDAGLLDVLHDARDERVLAVGEAVDVHLDGVGEITVDQERPLLGNRELRRPVEIGGKPRHVAIELRAVVH